MPGLHIGPEASRRAFLASAGIAAIASGDAAPAADAPAGSVCPVAQLGQDLGHALRRYHAAEQAWLAGLPGARPFGRDSSDVPAIERLAMAGRAESFEGALLQIILALTPLRDVASWLDESDPSYAELTLAERALLSAVNFMVGAGVPIGPEVAGYYFAPADLAEVPA